MSTSAVKVDQSGSKHVHVCPKVSRSIFHSGQTLLDYW